MRPDPSGHAVVYEVDLSVEEGIAVAYLRWLREHVEAMLALPGFLAAELFEVLDPVEPGYRRWCVVYRLEDRAALERYLACDAPRMREEGLRRFGGRFQARRRIMEGLHASPMPPGDPG
ncbi:MAG: hypothetical protein KatS3mg126_0797 [Lysobacteraceae bacterium]|nr:MAG: hypothetical protein KatS3mg126_0797 [Xanthomonadaceae bacterium]